MHVLQSNIDHGHRGGRPHRSFDDPGDPLEVITARLFDKNGSRIDSMHIHKDGSTKLKSEQSGKKWVASDTGRTSRSIPQARSARIADELEDAS